jgi:hypothetical protein
MKVIAGPEAARLIQEHGGRLFVWTDLHRCCSGNITYLKTGSALVEGRHFERTDAAGFELWFDFGSKTPPDELFLEAKGWKKRRVEAYWNGCVYAI